MPDEWTNVLDEWNTVKLIPGVGPVTGLKCYVIDIGPAQAVARRNGFAAVPYSEWRITGREEFNLYTVDLRLKVDISPNQDVDATVDLCKGKVCGGPAGPGGGDPDEGPTCRF